MAATGGVSAALYAQHEGSASEIVEFRGEHQAGIVTAAQDRLHFASFDVITEDRSALTLSLIHI